MSDSNDSHGTTIAKDKGEEKAIFEVEDAPRHYIREGRNMLNSTFSQGAHHLNVC